MLVKARKTTGTSGETTTETSLKSAAPETTDHTVAQKQENVSKINEDLESKSREV